MKPKITWVLIADGARARILQHKGPGLGLEALDGMEFSDERLQARDIMADKPGRSFNSGAPGRAAMEYSTDPVAKKEADFASQLARALKEHLDHGDYEQLVLAAAPKTLGNLRQLMPKQVQSTIEAEIPKDLTRVPNDQIEKHFEKVLPV